MSKRDDLIDQYLELCDEANERPELDGDGEPDPYSPHARRLRQAAKNEVVKVERNDVAGIQSKGEIVHAVAQVLGRTLGDAIGRQIAPIREELGDLRAEMRSGRQTQEGIRKQMRANRPRGAPLTDDEWDEHERNYQIRGL